MAEELKFTLRADSSQLSSAAKKGSAALGRMGTSGKSAGDRITRSTRGASRSIQRMAASSDAAGGSFKGLALKLGVAAGGFYAIQRAISSAIATVDELASLANRLRLVTDSERELAQVQEDLFQISQRSRSGLAETTELYARVAIAAGDLGRSQGEMLQLTEAVSKAVTLSGASASEAQAGIIQFGQALASGRLQGDELRSVLENLPALAREIAAGLGVPIGQIRELASAGELTANAIVDAILNRQGAIEEAYGSFVPTVSQSYETLRSSASRFLQLADEQVGVTERLSKEMASAADQINLWSQTISDTKTRQELISDLEDLTENYHLLKAAIRSATGAQLDLIEAELQAPLADLTTQLSRIDTELDIQRARAERNESSGAKGTQYFGRKKAIDSEITELGKERAALQEALDHLEERFRLILEQRERLGDDVGARHAGSAAGTGEAAETAEVAALRESHRHRIALLEAQVSGSELQVKIVELQIRESQAIAKAHAEAEKRKGSASEEIELIRERTKLQIDAARAEDRESREAEAANEEKQRKREAAEKAKLEIQKRDLELEYQIAEAGLRGEEQQRKILEIRKEETEEMDRLLQLAVELDLSQKETEKHQAQIQERARERERQLRAEEAREQRIVALQGQTESASLRVRRLELRDGDAASPELARARYDYGLAQVAAEQFTEDITPAFAKVMLEELLQEYQQALSDIEEAGKPAHERLINEWRRTAKTMGEALEDGLARGIEAGEDAFADFVRTGKLSIKSFGSAIVDELSRAFYRSSIAPLISSFASSAFSFFAPSNHTGGIVGQGGAAAAVYPASAFLGAPRMHSGGLVGPDEVPTILQRGEGVFTPAQMRALAPVGSGPGRVVVELRNEGSQPQEIVSATPTMRGSDLIVGVVTKDLGRNGPIAQSLTSTFNLRRGSNG